MPLLILSILMSSVYFATSLEDSKPNWFTKEDFDMADVLESLNITDLRPELFRNMSNLNIRMLDFDIFNSHRIGNSFYEFMSASTDKALKWPDATIPYILDPTLDSNVKLLIPMAISDIQRVTCIRFVPAAKYVGPSWVKPLQIRNWNNSWCAASLGMNKDRTSSVMSLSSACAHKFLILHEFGHIIGFGHEHNREDRDDFIAINWETFTEAEKSPYGKADKTYKAFTPYDYNSILHYTDGGFMKSKTNVPVPLTFAQTLSRWDIVKFNKYHNCGEKLTSCKDVNGESWCKTNGLGMAANGNMDPTKAQCFDPKWSENKCLKTCGDCLNSLRRKSVKRIVGPVPKSSKGR